MTGGPQQCCGTGTCTRLLFHRHIRPAPREGLELRLHHRKRTLQVAALVIMGPELLAPEGVVQIHLLPERSSLTGQAVRLERDERRPTHALDDGKLAANSPMGSSVHHFKKNLKKRKNSCPLTRPISISKGGSSAQTYRVRIPPLLAPSSLSTVAASPVASRIDAEPHNDRPFFDPQWERIAKRPYRGTACALAKEVQGPEKSYCLKVPP